MILVPVDEEPVSIQDKEMPTAVSLTQNHLRPRLEWMYILQVYFTGTNVISDRKQYTSTQTCILSILQVYMVTKRQSNQGLSSMF